MFHLRPCAYERRRAACPYCCHFPHARRPPCRARHRLPSPQAIRTPSWPCRSLPMLYDLPAEHWDHLRTTNPIESVFATVRHRTARSKGALSQDTARLMVFKLVMAAAKTWRRLQGENQLPKVVRGVTFRDGVEVTVTPEQTAA